MKKYGSNPFSAFVLFAIVLLVSACAPRVDNEIQYWGVHKNNVVKMGTQWPVTKPLLEARLQKAAVVWAEAEKITDEKKKAEKMKEANTLLNDFLDHIVSVDSKITSVKGSINSFNSLKIKATHKNTRINAINAAFADINAANKMLLESTAKTEEELVAVAKAANSKLYGAQSKIDIAKKKVKK